MSHFLEGLDQWALGILMGICTFFGVKELPPEPDPNWKVEQQWVKQPDGHYLLVISSETIQDQCRNGSAKYIVFPQTYMAKQEVYADSLRVYTNEMDKEWHLKSFLDRPVVICDLLGFAKKIDFKVQSYGKYFASINGWPSGKISYPRGQSFYNFSYVIMGVVTLFCGVIFFLIGVSFKEKSYDVLVMSMGLFMVMYSHYPAYASAIDVDLAHQFTLIGILIVAYVVLFEKNLNKIFHKWNLAFFIFVISEFSISYTYPHTAQLLMVTNASVGLIIGFIFFFREKVLSRKMMLLCIVILGARDLYNAQIQRDGFLNLSLLCLVITCFMSYRLVLKIYNKNLFLIREQEKFKGEITIIKKMREINLKFKQIIHDMKSPLTSLNFMVSSNNLSADSLHMPIDRLNKLLQISSEDNVGALLDWYSVKILDEAIKIIFEEKKHIAKNCSYSSGVDDGFFVFFDPDIIKTLIAELIDNSIKNNSPDIKIVANLQVNHEKKILLKYHDYGIGISKEKMPNIGMLGYSEGGTGLGIYSIFKRLKDFGAEINIAATTGSGFSADIKFLTRDIKP